MKPGAALRAIFAAVKRCFVAEAPAFPTTIPAWPPTIQTDEARQQALDESALPLDVERSPSAIARGFAAWAYGGEIAPSPRRGRRLVSGEGGWHDPESSRELGRYDTPHDRFYVYVLRIRGGYYIGHSKNVERRLEAHISGEVVSTAGRNPKLIWKSCAQSNRSGAARYEAAMKCWYERGSAKFFRIIGAAQPGTFEVMLR